MLLLRENLSFLSYRLFPFARYVTQTGNVVLEKPEDTFENVNYGQYFVSRNDILAFLIATFTNI